MIGISLNHSQRNNKASRYVLVTAAKNEEAYIERTLQSIVAQSVLPQKWVIVSDGSTDNTDEIVRRWAGKYDFIELLRKEPELTRNFGAKARAVRLGVERLCGTEYSFLGNLDADVTVEPDYYEKAMAKFEEDPHLGIAGGLRFDNCRGTYRKVLASPNSAGGPTQFFRRECYEQIGGYLSVRLGGVDYVAEIMARMHGWKVRTFPDLKLWHHRRTGTENRTIFAARFHEGISAYIHGCHPLFELSRCIYRVFDRPYLLGSVFRLGGYCWAVLCREEKDVPEQVVRYLRREQIDRLWSVARKLKKSKRVCVNISSNS